MIFNNALVMLVGIKILLELKYHQLLLYISCTNNNGCIRGTIERARLKCNCIDMQVSKKYKGFGFPPRPLAGTGRGERARPQDHQDRGVSSFPL